MSDDPKRYPQGKIAPDDEGELLVAVSSHTGVVRVDFNKAVAWLGLDAAAARTFARSVLAHARELERAQAPAVVAPPPAYPPCPHGQTGVACTAFCACGHRCVDHYANPSTCAVTDCACPEFSDAAPDAPQADEGHHDGHGARAVDCEEACGCGHACHVHGASSGACGTARCRCVGFHGPPRDPALCR